jgi:chorismate mutase/prephenate dehydratase
MDPDKEQAGDRRPDDELEGIRREINRVDRELLALLNRRAELSLSVGRIKSRERKDVFDPLREKDVLQNLLERNPGPLPAEHLQAVYREILSSSRSLQRIQKVVYLGPEGTFSYLAGLRALGRGADFRPLPGLEDVFRCVRNASAELGVIPLENSLQGTVGQSLDLFLVYDVFIQAEISCRITHSLLSRSPDLAGIRTVCSHPQALQQCTGWLRANLPRAEIVPVDSTAAAAQRVRHDPGEAAVAHAALADAFGLNVLARSIEDLPENWTRFLIIGRNPAPPGKKDKSSVLFTLPDKPGSLAAVLDILARDGVNMKKLESRPLREGRWQYAFFADLECDLAREEYGSTLQRLRDACHHLRLLGSYPAGMRAEETDLE